MTVADDGRWFCSYDFFDGKTLEIVVKVDFPFFISEPAVHVLEGAWGAIVVLCARSDTVIEWNHANEDGFSVHTATGAECGGTGQFYMTSMIFGSRSGDIDFEASIKSTDCAEESTFDSNTAACSCPASAFMTTTPCPETTTILVNSTSVEVTCPTAPPPQTTKKVTCPTAAPALTDVTTATTTTLEAEAAAVEKSSSKSASSTCKQSGKLSATAVAFLVLCIVEVLAVVVLAKRLFGIKRKQRDKTAGEGGGEAEAGTAAKEEPNELTDVQVQAAAEPGKSTEKPDATSAAGTPEVPGPETPTPDTSAHDSPTPDTQTP